MKLVIGTTSISLQAEKQYRTLGFDVMRCDSLPESLSDCDELFVALPMQCQNCFEADSENLAMITPLLETYDPEKNDGKKLLCQFLFYSRGALHVFRVNGLSESLSKKVEFWPFATEDLSVQKINYDRRSVHFGSDSIIHIVLFGMTSWTESVAIDAAIRCHYPNYVRDHSLRTRITIVDENIDVSSEKFMARYHNLFENTYVRYVDVPGKRSYVTRPKYAGTREDFVDIEWELVKGSATDETLLEKLALWSSDSGQQLTAVFCYDDSESNLVFADMLSSRIGCCSSMMYVAVDGSGVFNSLKYHKNVIPLCEESGLDVTLPYRRMAQIVNYVYSECYGSSADNLRVPSEIDVEAAARLWNNENDASIRWSSICNAMSIRSKMHSLGHTESDWSTFYSVNAREIEILAQVEHNRWSVEKLMSGYRPLTDAEQESVIADRNMKKVLKAGRAHYDLRSYLELGSDETGKQSRIYDICLSGAIPLIATVSHTCLTGMGE